MDAGSVITMVFDVGLAVVVLGVIIGGILLSRRQQSHAAAGQGPYAGAAQALSRAPTTRLGYVSSATETGGRGYGGQAARTKMVRTVGTCPLSWTSEAPSTGHSVRMAFSWDSTLATPARVPLHVAPARLVGLTGSATDAVTNRTRSFRPRYSVAIRDLPPHGARATDVVECSRTACTDSQSEWSGANASAYARPRERKSLAMVRPVGQKNRCNEAGSSRRPTLSGPDDDTASDARVQTMAPVFLALRNREDGRMTRGDRKIRSAAGMFAVGAGSPRRSWWGWPWACKGSGSSRPSPTVYLAECASGWASGGGPYAQKRSSGRHAMRTMTRTLVSGTHLPPRLADSRRDQRDGALRHRRTGGGKGIRSGLAGRTRDDRRRHDQPGQRRLRPLQTPPGYLFGLKGTQPELPAEAERLLAHLPHDRANARTEETVGRKLERRLLWRTTEMAAYQSNEAAGRFKDPQWLTIVRAHWQVENGTHKTLDAPRSRLCGDEGGDEVPFGKTTAPGRAIPRPCSR